MSPRTLTAEQVAEFRSKRAAFNPREIIPQAEDTYAAMVAPQESRQPADPRTLTAAQVDEARAKASIAAETGYGRALGLKPDMEQGPIRPPRTLTRTQVDQARYEKYNAPAYMPTMDEWKWLDGHKKQRNDRVGNFLKGAKGMAGALVDAGAAVFSMPADFWQRGTKAYDEWVNSAAEGVRQSGIGVAELWSWAGDMLDDQAREGLREVELDKKLRQQMAAENRFTGNEQADFDIFRAAKEQARQKGFYAPTPEEQAEDDSTRYQRFIRDKSFVRQAGNITQLNLAGAEGSVPDGQAEMGIDPKKVNPGLMLASQFVTDPLNVPLAGGLGALNRLRVLRRVSSLAGAPLKGLGKAAGGTANFLDRQATKIAEKVEARTGMDAATAQTVASMTIPKAGIVFGVLRAGNRVLRVAERGFESGSILAREVGTGGVGVTRADAAATLRGAAIPERYRRAFDGFFTSADSSLRRVSETPGLSPILRRSAATADKLGFTQAFRAADDVVSGAVATTPFSVPLAAVSPEDRRDELLGGLAMVGAAGGFVGGKVRRIAEANDALVAKMLADAHVSGGDPVYLANKISHDGLLDMARKQTMISAKADFIPLGNRDYAANTAIRAANGAGTRGIHIDATSSARPKIFINVDKLANGDIAGHEIGHAIFRSNIMGGKIRQSMRAEVDLQYGKDGLEARGREYAEAAIRQDLKDGTTGVELSVLTPEQTARLRAVAGDKKATEDLKAEFVRERYAADPEFRKTMLDDAVNARNQNSLATGETPWDWARDEIAAETFSGLGRGLNLDGLRASGPIGRSLGAMRTALEFMGAKFRGNGRLETPNQLFVENPLFDSPQMRKAVNRYVKMYDNYLVGLEREGKVQQRGTPISPTGRAQDAARSPHTRVYKNGAVVESDLFIQRPDGTFAPKSQQQINTQEAARAATLKSLYTPTQFATSASEWGARKLANGRIEVGGPTLPAQFDHFVQVPEWLRQKAREFEAGRPEGRSYIYSYNAIGTGAGGSYKIKNLGNVEAKVGEAVPFGWAVSQKNHLLAKVIDLNSVRAAALRAIDGQQLGEFGNDMKQVEAGVKQLLKNYNDGVPGETGLGLTKKNILNALIGTGTAVHKSSNPVWHTLNNQGAVRTFRFDRLNYADPYDTGWFPHYEKININALPDNAGAMSPDQWRQFDADRKVAWMRARAAERGFSNEKNWQEADPASFRETSAAYHDAFPERPIRGQAMPDAPANLTTDQILRELEENQGYLGLSTLGMREGRPVKGGAQRTRELLKRNDALNEELRRRGGTQEESDVQRVLRQRGQAMPDVILEDDVKFAGREWAKKLARARSEHLTLLQEYQKRHGKKQPSRDQSPLLFEAIMKSESVFKSKPNTALEMRAANNALNAINKGFAIELADLNVVPLAVMDAAVNTGRGKSAFRIPTQDTDVSILDRSGFEQAADGLVLNGHYFARLNDRPLSGVVIKTKSGYEVAITGDELNKAAQSSAAVAGMYNVVGERKDHMRQVIGGEATRVDGREPNELFDSKAMYYLVDLGEKEIDLIDAPDFVQVTSTIRPEDMAKVQKQMGIKDIPMLDSSARNRPDILQDAKEALSNDAEKGWPWIQMPDDEAAGYRDHSFTDRHGNEWDMRLRNANDGGPNFVLELNGRRVAELRSPTINETRMTNEQIDGLFGSVDPDWFYVSQQPKDKQPATGRTRGQAMPDVGDAPPFYLKSSQAIDVKVQGKAATPDQIKAILTNPQNGIKAEELKWTGVMQEVERLAKENNGKVPKDALLRYLAEDGAVRLEEVQMGGVKKQWTQADIDQLEREAQRTRDFSAYERAVLEYEDQQLGSDANNTGNQTRYGQYQLPGGENYREVVLAMPAKPISEKGKRRQFIDQRLDAIKEMAKQLEPLESVDPAAKREMARLESEYAELAAELKTIPIKEAQITPEYTSPHFDTPNYVAHMRLNDRVDAKGKPGLFIEEIQSDRHQQARTSGYREDIALQIGKLPDGWKIAQTFRTNNGDPKRSWDILKADGSVFLGGFRGKKEAMAEYNRHIEEKTPISGIPDAPFRTSWPLQLFKRALRDAVADGKDWIGWTTGETQAARYDLSKQVDSIEITKPNATEWDVYAYVKNGDNINRRVDSIDKVAEIVGKDIARKVVDLKDGYGETFRGNDLKVGGEGMKGFYDTMVPKDVAKYVKQWGGQVEKVDAATRATIDTPQALETVRYIRGQGGVATASRSMEQAAKVNSLLAQLERRMSQDRISFADAWTEIPNSTAKNDLKSVLGFRGIKGIASLDEIKPVAVWRVNITPQMREGIKKAGQALFVGGAAAVVADDQTAQ